MIGRTKRHTVKTPQALNPDIAPERANQLTLVRQEIVTAYGRTKVVVDESESPLVWLARRRGRDGQPLIASHQLLAGERLRRDFTLAHLMPRTTTDWSHALSVSGFNPEGSATDEMVAARQRVHRALNAVGPDLAGLLLDVCCFLKRLEDVERERCWPLRSAKVVLQLALTQLARHYGYREQARGGRKAVLRTWLAEDAVFTSGDS